MERGRGLIQTTYNLPIQVPLEEILWEEPEWLLWQPEAIARGGGKLVRVEQGGCHAGYINSLWLPVLLGKKWDGVGLGKAPKPPGGNLG